MTCAVCIQVDYNCSMSHSTVELAIPLLLYLYLITVAQTKISQRVRPSVHHSLLMAIRLVNHLGNRVLDFNIMLTLAVSLWRESCWNDLEFGIDAQALHCSAEVFARYKAFLCLKAAFSDLRGQLFAPQPAVDKVWHRHILRDAFRYRWLSERLVGSMIHHREVSSGIDRRRMQNNFKKACRSMMREIELIDAAAAAHPGSANGDDEDDGIGVCA